MKLKLLLFDVKHKLCDKIEDYTPLQLNFLLDLYYPPLPEKPDTILPGMTFLAGGEEGIPSKQFDEQFGEMMKFAKREGL